MEVILREHVDNLERRGEIVKVADGYARNYLLPRKLALLATDGNKQRIERETRRVRRRKRPREEGRRSGGRTPGQRRGRVRAQGRRDRRALRLGDQQPTSPTRSAAKGFDIDRRKIQLREPIGKLERARRADSSPARA